MVNSVRSHKPQLLIVVAIMLVFFAQLVFGSLQLSMTADEPPDMTLGYVMLTTGDTWAIPGNGPPPLVTLWSTWPILLQPERPDPRTVPFWHGDDLADYTRALCPLLGPIERLALATRYPIMLLAAVLMALVYRWARDGFGHWGGILAIAIMAWDPTLIAHSQLNTTDLGITLFAFACMFVLHRLRQRFTWKRLAMIGLLLGAAMASKTSGVFLIPAVGIGLGWGYWSEASLQWQKFFRQRADAPVNAQALLAATYRWTAYLAIILIIGGLTLWACYGFEWRAVGDMPYPLPLATHIRILRTAIEQKDRVAFLWGQHQSGGWWWYFPFAFAIKTPIPLIVGLVVTVLAAIRQRRQSLWQIGSLWLFPALYIAAAIPSGLNIGYRHLLPASPFVYTGMGQLAPWLAHLRPDKRRIANMVAVALGIWYVASTLSIYPYALAYFNELVGGPGNGYRYLVDSNLDWGQSFKALKSYMDNTGIKQVWLSYFTYVDPAVYGVRYRPLYPAPNTEPILVGRFDPLPGVYVLSATPMQGIMQFSDLYDWFRHQEPSAKLGYGLLVYRIEPSNSRGKWVAQCTKPEPPLDSQIIEEGFGRTDLRVIQFDCTSSWIYPDEGRTPGWYALHRELGKNQDSFVRQHLAPARMTYQQGWYYDESPFAIFQWQGNLLGGESTHTAPLRMNGPLTFLGYRLSSATTRHVKVETSWKVEALLTRPISIAMRLSSEDDLLHATSEGLGIAMDQLQPGDVLVQRHQLDMPAGAHTGRYWLQASVLWLDTRERWQVQETLSGQLPLTAIEIK